MAFEFAGLAYRNPGWVTDNAREAWATAKAMKAYRRENPACEFCGDARRIQVHHIEPVSVAPQLAAESSNMISLCAKRCHITLGHCGNYRSRYVENVREVCRSTRVMKTESARHETDTGAE